jgi:hypothetical protein
LWLRPLIAPDDCGPNHLVVFIQQDRPMHLPGKSDAGDRLSASAWIIESAADRLTAGFPPIPGILLGPSQMRGGKRRVVCGSGGNDSSSLVNNQSASPARADIDPEELDISSCMPLPGEMREAELAEVLSKFRRGGAVGKWESRALCGISERGGKVCLRLFHGASFPRPPVPPVSG